MRFQADKLWTVTIVALLTLSSYTQPSLAQTATETPAPAGTQTETTTAAPVDKATAQQRFRNNLDAIGVTFTQENENIDVVVDQKKAIDALPMLESQGVIPKIAAKDIQTSPLALAVGVVGISFTIVIMNTLFTENPSLNKVKVKTFVLPSGNTNKQLCFSFDYTREMFKKMDLDKLTPRDFIVNTPGFNFTQWCRTTMDKEAKART